MSQPFVTLIDADTNLNRHLIEQLSRYGLKTEALQDAGDLMQRKDDLPNLIVLCIDPKRTGWAVCNRLRKSAQLKAVPLIITSAEATEKDFEDHKKLKTRAEDYLHKPFGTEALIEKIGTLIGLPVANPADSQALEIPGESEEIQVEDDGMVLEESAEMVEEPIYEAAAAPPQQLESSSFATEDSQDRTRIAPMGIDDDLSVETDAAFAALGADADENTSMNVAESLSQVELTQNEEPAQPAQQPTDPYALEESPFEPAPLPDVEPEPMPQKQPSVDLDLGLEQVAQAASEAPQRSRRKSQPGLVLTSAPAPEARPSLGAHDTSAHATDRAAVDEIRAERDRLKRELEELKSRPAPKAEAAPSGGGFSREREFLNLREIINKKEKEILDLRDNMDAKERLVLDGKDRLRELERRARDLDEKSLATERELVAVREKAEALAHDKERVVEREKQVKGRLDDALKTIARYEEEVEGWKQKHAADTGALEQSYNDAVSAHQAEVQELKARHATAEEAVREQHATQLREALDTHEGEKTALEQSFQAERGRQEAEHARALQGMRESKDTERESLRLRFEQQIAEMTEQHQVEIQGQAEQSSQLVGQLKTEHDNAIREANQLHADELAGLRARHTADARIAERKHADEIKALHESYRGELAAADDKRLQELALKDDEHRAEVEKVIGAHLRDKQQLEQDHGEALQAADDRRVAELAAAASAHAGELARVSQVADQKLADEIKSLRDNHLRKVQALEESHADLKMGMQQRHAQQIDELKAQHAATVAEFEAAVKERDQLITEGHDKLTALEQTLARERSTSSVIDRQRLETQAALDTVRNDLSERDGKLSDRERRIAELEQESAGYQDQILKAYQRIKSDESIVSRAKKALAIALTLLDESNADGGDEKSS